MLQNTSGQEIDYDAFAAMFEKFPKLKNLVDRFDGRGLVIKTKAKEQPTEFGKKPGIDKSAANRAADKVLKQPG